jgi:hypothetical protein
MDELERVKIALGKALDHYDMMVSFLTPASPNLEVASCVIALSASIKQLSDSIYMLTPEPPCPFAGSKEKEPWE